MLSYFETRTRIIALVAIGASLLALVLKIGDAGGVVVFGASAVGLAGLAAMVGEATDQLGHRLGSGATGVLQSALGNLPELFIGIFALRAGLVEVVRSALVGSILANTLLVLGLAFLAGGLRHGPQRFGADKTRMMSTLLLLAVAAMAIPTIATAPGGPDQGHATELSVFVSDWFVESLRPAMSYLGMSESFAGLVVVAIAGNAVENVVGVQSMLRDKGDLAISLILNSSLQVALALTPVLVILSLVAGGAVLTLVLSPLLVVGLALATLLVALVVIDGESTWLEGLALIGLYVILAASVWWGAPIG